MRGRNKKPLAVIAAEGGRIRNDRINREAPVPPMGEMIAPCPLTVPEKIIWDATLKSAAPGQLRPADSGLLYRYCSSYARLLTANREYVRWCAAPKGAEETELLKLGANLVLGAHPILGVIDKLMQQVAQQESKLGLTPVDREHIHAEAQRGLFDEKDPWAAYEAPSDSTQ